MLSIAISACSSIPKDTFKSDNIALQNVQTLKVTTTERKKVMSSLLSTLQDIGYYIEDTNYNLGFIKASKVADYDDFAKSAAVVFFGLKGHDDTSQNIHVNLYISSVESDGISIRTSISKEIFQSSGRSRIEPINAPEIYQDFNMIIRQSIFLEEN